MRTTRALLRRPPARGQALPFFALALPVLMAFMALGVDAGNLYLERRAAQGVADLAALTGAKSLPNATNAKNAAWSVAASNGYPNAQVTPTTPYLGANTKIEVTIRKDVDTFFMPVLSFFAPGDFSSQGIQARAVAISEPTVSGSYAVFALNSNCSGSEPALTIDWSGSSNYIDGSVHSQAGVLIGGSGNTVPAPHTFTYECPGQFTESGTNGGIPPENNPEACPGEFVNTPCLENRDPPVSFPSGTFNSSPNPPCNWTAAGDMDLSSGTSWWHNNTKDSKQLRAGKYCAPNGVLKLSDSDIRTIDYLGRTGVTFFARKIDISGSGFILKPYDRNVLAYATSADPDALKFAGSNGTFTGLLYAPNGTVETSGSTNSTLTGGIVANRVKINGSSLGITGTIGASSAGYQQLVE
jgi:hypothetical protein